jgi:hypothetical protein
MEIRSLTRSSFHLDADPPTVFLRAIHAKNRRDATLPLRQDVVEMLREQLAGLLPEAPAFALGAKKSGAEMLKDDLEAAGLKYIEDGRYFDFHALRHQFGSMLAAANVPVKAAMDLMRHSDVNLTMALYSHMALTTKAEAMEMMAPLSSPVQAQRLAVGAEGTSTQIPELDPIKIRAETDTGKAVSVSACTDSRGSERSGTPGSSDSCTALASIYADLTSVLCEPNGRCCITGSEADRQIVQDCLDDLRAMSEG